MRQFFPILNLIQRFSLNQARKVHIRKYVLLVLINISALAVNAQTTLSAGDIVILAYKGTGSPVDGFSFMPLVNLSTGTVIHFTDYGWSTTNTSFNLIEEGNNSGGGNMITYTAPSAVSAGTIITQDANNVGGSAFTAYANFPLNFNNTNYIVSFVATLAGHDGLLAFQGTYTNPTFITGFHTGQWGSSGYSNYYWSDLPSGLTNGTNAFYLADLTVSGNAGSDLTVDDAKYNGATTAATAAVWRERVNNSANWLRVSDNDPAVAFPTGSYTVTLPITSYTFSKNGTGNWSDIANWVEGAVPGSSADVTISQGNAVVNADYSCGTLTISSGTSVTIDPDNCLTVSGTLTNNAGVSGLVLSSTSAGNGTLLNNTAGVNATVKQFLTKNKWHYLGIPVTYIPDVADVLDDVYVLHMDESNAYDGLGTGWQYLNTGDSLLHLKGYAVQYNRPGNNDTTISFTGELNTGTIDTIFDSETEGWNFVSNPYPCAFDWDAQGARTLTNCNDAIYIWQSDNSQYGSYGTYVSGGSTNGQNQYISSNQGFYVQVWHVNSAISLTNSGKVNSEVSFASIDELPMNKKGEWLEGSIPNKHLATKSILIGITDDGVHFDEALIRTSPFARVDFDSELDAAKLVALESKTPQIYTLSEGREFSINTLESLNKESLIPINVLVKSNDKQTITVRSEDGFNENDVVYLYNPKGELLADLSKSDYTFEGSEGLINSYYIAFNRISKERLISYHQAVTSMHSKIESRTIKPSNGGMFSVQIQKLAQK